MPAELHVGGNSSANSENDVPNYPPRQRVFRSLASALLPCTLRGFAVWVTPFRTWIRPILVPLQIGDEDVSRVSLVLVDNRVKSREAPMNHVGVPLPALHQRSDLPTLSHGFSSVFMNQTSGEHL